MNNERTQSRKSCFAILADLTNPLATEGLTQDHVWSFLRQYYGVESRKEFGRVQWTEIASRLSMAKANPEIFDKLVRAVWRHHLTLPWNYNRAYLLL